MKDKKIIFVFISCHVALYKWNLEILILVAGLVSSLPWAHGYCCDSSIFIVIWTCVSLSFIWVEVCGKCDCRIVWFCDFPCQVLTCATLNSYINLSWINCCLLSSSKLKQRELCWNSSSFGKVFPCWNTYYFLHLMRVEEKFSYGLHQSR